MPAYEPSLRPCLATPCGRQKRETITGRGTSVADRLSLSSLKPADKRRDRKRVGRGLGSGKGRYSGRGIKGQKSRSGSHKMRAGFEGGQMPVYMRMPKQRGATSKDAMPIGPFMTKTQPVNLRDLEARFDDGAEVTPEALVEARIIKNTKTDVKILGVGDLSKKLSVSAHGFSVTAREKIEKAGGSVTWLRGEPTEEAPKSNKRRKRKAAKPAGAGASAAQAAETTEEPEASEASEASEAPAEDES
jgi:large subunit ribosomal protein L15